MQFDRELKLNTNNYISAIIGNQNFQIKTSVSWDLNNIVKQVRYLNCIVNRLNMDTRLLLFKLTLNKTLN